MDSIDIEYTRNREIFEAFLGVVEHKERAYGFYGREGAVADPDLVREAILHAYRLDCRKNGGRVPVQHYHRIYKRTAWLVDAADLRKLEQGALGGDTPRLLAKMMSSALELDGFYHDDFLKKIGLLK